MAYPICRNSVSRHKTEELFKHQAQFFLNNSNKANKIFLILISKLAGKCQGTQFEAIARKHCKNKKNSTQDDRRRLPLGGDVICCVSEVGGLVLSRNPSIAVIQ